MKSVIGLFFFFRHNQGLGNNFTAFFCLRKLQSVHPSFMKSVLKHSELYCPMIHVMKRVSLYPYNNYNQENFNPSFVVNFKGAKEK